MAKMESYSITDLQFGSTGKGLLAGFQAMIYKPDTIVTAWMPNAGHTYIHPNGTTMIHTMLANGVVSPKLKRVLIAPASVLDVDALLRELSHAVRNNCTKQQFEVLVHENATVLQPRHSEFERESITKIGSTQKGSGAAIMERLRRDPSVPVTAGRLFPHGLISGVVGYDVWVRVVTHSEYLDYLYGAELLALEGAQGYSLGVHSGFYPFTTSRECTVAQLASDTLFDPAMITHKYGACRTFPIRVANRTADNMTYSGWSGPGYPDQEETTFEAIGQKTEYTTVTKLPRRIFTWSDQQLLEAVKVNGTTGIFLNFCNYLQEEGDEGPAWDLVERIESLTGVPVVWTGWGPLHKDVKMTIANARTKE